MAQAGRTTERPARPTRSDLSTDPSSSEPRRLFPWSPIWASAEEKLSVCEQTPRGEDGGCEPELQRLSGSKALSLLPGRRELMVNSERVQLVKGSTDEHGCVCK